MIYGKISLEDWRTACVGGEEPESTFESYNLRLFFYGTLYNRDLLQESPDDSNAKLAAEVYLADPFLGFSRLDGSFTIVYYSKNECGVVRDHHGTHYPIYSTFEGEFSSSLNYMMKEVLKEDACCEGNGLSGFLQRGILPDGSSAMTELFSLGGGAKIHKVTQEGYLAPLKHKLLPAEVPSFYEAMKVKFPRLYEKIQDSLCKLKYHKVFDEDKVVVNADKHPDVESYSRRYGELHEQAIRRRIGDSRRVGILLSGGYASGSNLAALRNIYDGPIDSYSVGFKGDEWSELPMARLMSETFGTRHHEYEIDGSEISALPEIVRFLEVPFVEGGLMVNYCAMKMIGDDKPDVILGGDGSDQYFGTSGREVALHYLAARAGLRPLLRTVGRLLEHERFDIGGKLSRISFHLDRILHILEGERFGFTDSAVRKFLLDQDNFFKDPEPLHIDTRSFEHLYTQHALLSDLKISINRVILYKASRMAQMFGNNLTFPFMDLELYKFLQKLPVSLKCKGDSVWDIARGRCVSKYLLKHHYKPLLPEAVTAKKKQGGFAPMPIFFRDPVRRARLKDFILSSDIYEYFLDRSEVEKFLNAYEHIASRQDGWFWYRQNKALQYFNLLTLVTWWEAVYGEEEVSY